MTLLSHMSTSGHDFELLVSPLRAELLGHARHLTRGDSECEDIVQDALISAWQVWTKWEPYHPEDTQKSVKSWLYRIVSNEFMSRARASKVRRGVLDEFTMEIALGMGGTTPTRWHVRSTSKENISLSPQVEDAVSRLSPDRKAIVEYFYLRDNSCREISEKLGMKSSTVRTRLMRAHNRLRPLLARFAREQYHLGTSGVEVPQDTIEITKANSDCIDRVMRDDDSCPFLVVQGSPD